MLAEATAMVEAAQVRSRLGRPLTNQEIVDRCNAVRGQASFQDLAKLTGAHPETVRRYMRGGTIRADFLAAFAAAFRIDPSTLLFEQPAAVDSAERDARLEVVAALVRLLGGSPGDVASRNTARAAMRGADGSPRNGRPTRAPGGQSW